MVRAQELTEDLLKVVVFSNLKQGLLALAINIELIPYGHVAVHLGQLLAADDISGVSIKDLVFQKTVERLTHQTLLVVGSGCLVLYHALFALNDRVHQ